MLDFDLENLEKYIFYTKHDFKKIVEENGLPCTTYEFMKHWKSLNDRKHELMKELRSRIKYSIRYEPLSEQEIQALQIIGPNKFYNNEFILEEPKGRKKLEEGKQFTEEQIKSIEELEEKNEIVLKSTQDIITKQILDIKNNEMFFELQKKRLLAGVRLSIIGNFYGTNYYINVKDPENSLNAITGEWSDNIILHQTIEYFRNK